MEAADSIWKQNLIQKLNQLFNSFQARISKQTKVNDLVMIGGNVYLAFIAQWSSSDKETLYLKTPAIFLNPALKNPSPTRSKTWSGEVWRSSNDLMSVIRSMPSRRSLFFKESYKIECRVKYFYLTVSGQVYLAGFFSDWSSINYLNRTLSTYYVQIPGFKSQHLWKLSFHFQIFH